MLLSDLTIAESTLNGVNIDHKDTKNPQQLECNAIHGYYCSQPRIPLQSQKIQLKVIGFVDDIVVRSRV